jgi:hypothetical protein
MSDQAKGITIHTSTWVSEDCEVHVSTQEQNRTFVITVGEPGRGQATFFFTHRPWYGDVVPVIRELIKSLYEAELQLGKWKSE